MHPSSGRCRTGERCPLRGRASTGRPDGDCKPPEPGHPRRRSVNRRRSGSGDAAAPCRRRAWPRFHSQLSSTRGATRQARAEQLAGVHGAGADLVLLRDRAQLAAGVDVGGEARRRRRGPRRSAARAGRGCRRRSSGGRGRRTRDAGEREVRPGRSARACRSRGRRTVRIAGGEVAARAPAPSPGRRDRVEDACARPASRRARAAPGRRARSARGRAPGRASRRASRCRSRAAPRWSTARRRGSGRAARGDRHVARAARVACAASGTSPSRS